jgi:hypothetical protein
MPLAATWGIGVSSDRYLRSKMDRPSEVASSRPISVHVPVRPTPCGALAGQEEKIMLCDSKHVILWGVFTLVILPLSSHAGLPLEDSNPRKFCAEVRLAQQSLRNYQCSVEYVDSADYAARKRLWENALKAGDMPEHILKYYERDLEGTGRHYEFQKVVADSSGRIKVAHTVGRYDADGKQQPTQENTSAWDGDASMTYLPRGDGSPFGGAQITAGRDLCFQAMRHPLWSFGGRFYAALDQAIESGEKIEIQREPASALLRIRFAGGEAIAPTPKWAWAAVVDPARGFCVPEWEFTQPDGMKCRFSATFREVQPGVWFPTKGRMDGFFPDGMVESQTSVKITDVVVNDPNFSNNLFHIDLPPGTHVRDTVMGLQYVVGKADSTSVLGEQVTTAHIITKGVGPNDPPAEETFFLPHVKQALEKGTAFVLNLRTRKLMGVDANTPSQEVLNSLYAAGVGDLFWDGGIVVVGDTKIELVLGERTRSLPRGKMEHGARYRLPERVPLPCTLRVTDKAKSRFHMVVKEISEKGIAISYKLLPDR